MFGSEIYIVAIMLWVKEATGSPTLAGTVMMLGGLARFLSLLGGVLADRYSRVRIIVLLDLANGLAILGLAVAFLVAPHRTTLLLICLFVINLFRECCFSLFEPAVSSLIPDIVPKERLDKANSVMQSTYYITLLAASRREFLDFLAGENEPASR